MAIKTEPSTVTPAETEQVDKACELVYRIVKLVGNLVNKITDIDDKVLH